MRPANAEHAAPARIEPEVLGQVLREYMDVTQRLQTTHETLQREVIRLREELASKDRELERRQRLAALGELAAGVAHEVRNPLGAIQLYSGLLRKELQEADPALSLIEKIEAGIRAIDCVVQDTLALAPSRCRLDTLDVLELIDQACESCRPVLEAHGVRVVVRSPAGAALVRANRDGLRRVLVNIIANAAEVSPRGAAVEIGVACENDEVRVLVSDHGPGLPEDALDRIFDPFFTTKEHGTGLGLTIAHRLVEAHGGRLTARNAPHDGAQFEIVLPTAEAAARKESRPADAQHTSAA